MSSIRGGSSTCWRRANGFDQLTPHEHGQLLSELFARQHQDSWTKQEQSGWLWNGSGRHWWGDGDGATKSRRIECCAVLREVKDFVRSDVKVTKCVSGDRSIHGEPEIVEVRSSGRERMRNGGCREDRRRRDAHSNDCAKWPCGSGHKRQRESHRPDRVRIDILRIRTEKVLDRPIDPNAIGDQRSREPG